MDSISGKIWFGKVGQNLFCVLVLLTYGIWAEEERVHHTYRDCLSN